MLFVLVPVGLIALAAVVYFKKAGFEGKTLWDWMQLLLVPALLAGGAFLLNDAQNERDRKRENRRADQERAIAADRASADALRIYFQQMSDLVLTHGLRKSKPGSEVQALARTSTLTVLPQLTGERKGRVLQFLSAAGLLGASKPKVSLANADLSGVTLEPGTVLAGPVNLGGAHLENADFSDIRLGPDFTDDRRCRGVCFTVDLTGANLRGAKFRSGGISRATFDSADLRDADFSGAFILGSEFVASCVSGASFRHAGIAATEFRDVEGHGVDLSEATITHVQFYGRDLRGVDLRDAKARYSQLPAGWRLGTVTPSGPPSPRSICAAFEHRGP